MLRDILSPARSPPPSALKIRCMYQILENWIGYREDRLKIDKSEFLGLFKAGLSDNELCQALVGFQGSDIVLERLRKVLDAGRLDEHVYLQTPPIFNAELTAATARAWLNELARFCKDGGENELSQVLSAARVRFISRSELRPLIGAHGPNSWPFSYVADQVNWPLMNAPRKTFGLIEAAYGLGADYYLAWYITQPVLAVELDPSKYFDLWKAGGRGVLTSEEFLIQAV